jgi:uncharacterized lipoprotein YajG
MKYLILISLLFLSGCVTTQTTESVAAKSLLSAWQAFTAAATEGFPVLTFKAERGV